MSDYDGSFGKMIREARRKQNLTQQELGDRLEPPVHKSQISRWEKGVVEVPARYTADLWLMINAVADVNETEFQQQAEAQRLHLENINMVGSSHLAAKLWMLKQSQPLTRLRLNEQGFPLGYSQEEEIQLELSSHTSYAILVENLDLAPRVLPGDVVIVSPYKEIRVGALVVVGLWPKEGARKRGEGYQLGLLGGSKEGVLELRSALVELTPRIFSEDEVAFTHPITQVILGANIMT